MEYTDKVAIVTGASSGIGYETARALARRGAVVVAVARREERLQRLVEDLRRHSPGSSYCCGDLSSSEFAEHVVGETLRLCGRLDILVNNAGIPKHKHVYHLSAEEAEQVMKSNFLSAVWMTLAALPPMLARGGGFIVNVSSVVAKVIPPREGIYAASKAAMNSFTEGLWNDLAGSDIHAAIVHTGPIDTEIWDKQGRTPGLPGREASAPDRGRCDLRGHREAAPRSGRPRAQPAARGGTSAARAGSVPAAQRHGPHGARSGRADPTRPRSSARRDPPRELRRAGC